MGVKKAKIPLRELDSEYFVNLVPEKLDMFLSLIGHKKYHEIRGTANEFRDVMKGRTFWHINSTPSGGGVAEMLPTYGALFSGIGIDTQWGLIKGDPDFFNITKRIHNQIHGKSEDRIEFNDSDKATYDQTTSNNLEYWSNWIKPGDVVIVHDPQPAGMIPAFKKIGAHVIWRCHIGVDEPNSAVDEVWKFLQPYIEPADGVIFTKRSYVPKALRKKPCWIITPSIDPFSEKNRELNTSESILILSKLGFYSHLVNLHAPVSFVNARYKTIIPLMNEMRILREGPPPSVNAKLFTQVSRWDSLKDPIGVMRAWIHFITQVTKLDLKKNEMRLVLAGPEVSGVSDDPEQSLVYRQCVEHWSDLPKKIRSTIDIVECSMKNVEENAISINALQRQSYVLIQKSLQEGFGLTVTEGMWKNKAVIASAIGGIPLQIQDKLTGRLVKNPEDIYQMARIFNDVSRRPENVRVFGERAKKAASKKFLSIQAIEKYMKLVIKLLS